MKHHSNSTIQYPNLHWKLFNFLVAGFMLFTVIGTLTHEFAHWSVAEYYGHPAKISYGYISYLEQEKEMPWTFVHSLNTIAAGPLQTMSTGSLGLLLLFLFEKHFRNEPKLLFWQWMLIFMALFWLRQTANFVMQLFNYFISGKISTRSDEVRLAIYLELPWLSISAITAFIGFVVLQIVLFRFVPKYSRFTFVVAGLVGGICGYVFWLETFGPILMP